MCRVLMGKNPGKAEFPSYSESQIYEFIWEFDNSKKKLFLFLIQGKWTNMKNECNDILILNSFSKAFDLKNVMRQIIKNFCYVLYI